MKPIEVGDFRASNVLFEEQSVSIINNANGERMIINNSKQRDDMIELLKQLEYTGKPYRRSRIWGSKREK